MAKGKPISSVNELKAYTFRVIIEEDPFEDGRMAYHAWVPALQAYSCYAWGYTVEEALENLREIVEMVIEELREEGKPIPTQPAEQVVVLEGPRITVNR
jgi:predicted RNase H-like HicB family nuclease